ncbi:hypothetical protein ACFFRR_003822 [Megaselia abdita]
MEILDYITIVITLGISTSIGFYYGFFKQSSTSEEYMMGGRKMKTIPIAISLIASQVSPLSIMGFPSEIYLYGITFSFFFVMFMLVVLILNYLIIPIFYENNVTNCYDYIEKRFDRRTMIFLKMLFFLQGYVYLPVISYLASLALSDASGVNVHLVNTMLCSICIVYTMIGGIKAVVWTDVVQIFVICIAVILISVIALIRVGSLEDVILKASNLGILKLNTNFDLTSRATVWNCSMSGLIVLTSYLGLNQSCVQRIISLPSINHAKKALLIFTIGFLVMQFIVIFLGVIMASYFSDCDPLTDGHVKQSDNIVSYFVQQISGEIPGMQGIFVSSIICAALSTISANVNALSGALFKDCVQPFIPTLKNDQFIIQLLVLASGVYMVLAGVFVDGLRSTSLQLIFTINNLAYASFFTTFMLGFLAPRIHSKPMILANICSFILMTIVILTGQTQFNRGDFKYESIERNTSYCINESFIDDRPFPEPFDVFKMSYHWYSVFGAVTIWIVAEVLSKCLKKQEGERLDNRLFAYWIRTYSKKEKLRDLEVSFPLKSYVLGLDL